MSTATIDATFAVNVLTENTGLTPEGFLICRDVTIARSGWQRYKGSDIAPGLRDDDEYRVFRPANEVFSRTAMASAEGKCVTRGHPPVFVTPENVSWYSCGHMQGVRKGGELKDGEAALVADLVIVDQRLIQDVRSGNLREVSLGYECTYYPIGDDAFEQRGIRINHAAIVPSGRAGSQVRIYDSKGNVMNSEILEITEQLKAMNAALDCFLEQRAGKNARRTRGDAASFTESLRRESPAYAAYDAAQREAQNFSDAARAAGAAMAEKFRPASCRTGAVPLREHAEDRAEDWAASVNAAGRKLRGK